MDRVKLSRIDEDLESAEVAALCFLCRDVVTKKRLQGVQDAKDLFQRLDEKGLLENSFFLSQLLKTIHREKLVSLLETDGSQQEETDASPPLSQYRKMLYTVYDDLTQENFEKIKFLLSDRMAKKQIESCSTALDLFTEMEQSDLLSKTNLTPLHDLLHEFDQKLALTVQHYRDEVNQQEPIRSPHNSIEHQPNSLPVPETQPSDMGAVFPDADPSIKSPSDLDETEYYIFSHHPRGLCVIFNNENFPGTALKYRAGSLEDKKSLSKLFTRLGFEMLVYDDLTAQDMQLHLKELGERNFKDHDALVVCVLSHGENGCVFGTDEQPVFLGQLTQPFTSDCCPTLAGKPKLFFIQACQGSSYQRGSSLLRNDKERSSLEADAGRVSINTIPVAADVLLGMATVPEYRSFRNTATGSIYIQQLCKQLKRSAESSENDDILTVLTRVNREVSKGVYLSHKQMPEPKYTLTKKLVLKYVR